MAIAIASITIFDMHDISSSSTPPTNPQPGTCWVDNSVNPPVLKMWDGNKWVIIVDSGDINSKITDLTSKYSASSSEIELLKEGIKDTVKKVDYNSKIKQIETDIGGIKTTNTNQDQRLTTAEGNIVNLGSTISSKVSIKEVQAEINKIEVGNLNFVQNASCGLGKLHWTSTDIFNVDKDNGIFELPNGGTLSNALSSLCEHGSSKRYVFSALMAMETAAGAVSSADITLIVEHTKTDGKTEQLFRTTFKHQSKTLKAIPPVICLLTQFTNVKVRLTLIIPAGNKIKVSKPQFERGTFPTDFTESFEDIKAAMESADREISQNIDGIGLEVTDIKESQNITTGGAYNVRYIRDFLNGSSVNSSNHWIEITATTNSGTNVALGKTVTTNGTSAASLSVVTDGNISGTYASAIKPTNADLYVQVDLGSVYKDINYITVYHYFADSRIYNDTKVQVSEDGVNWVTLFNSKVSGKYTETSTGLLVPVNLGNSIKDINKDIQDTKLLVTPTAIVSTVRESAAYKGDIANINKAISDQKKELLGNITTVSGTLTETKAYIDGAFKDGVISQSEADTIKRQLETLDKDKRELDKTYTELYGNPYLRGTPKSQLKSYKDGYNTAHSNLVSTISSIIADNKATESEKTQFTTKYRDYNEAYGNFQLYVQKALDGIAKEMEKDLLVGVNSTIEQTKKDITLKVEENTNLIDKTKELSNYLADAKMINNDPTFKKGLNDISIYNNSNNQNVTLSRIARTPEIPTSSTHFVTITTTGVASPGLGGFAFRTQSRANAVFIAKFIAKIPKDYSLNVGHNSFGTGSSVKWLTSNAGTGAWEEYYYRLKCGASGTFGTTMHFYLASSKTTVEWSLCYATVFDCTDSDNRITDLETKVGNDIKGVSDSLKSLEGEMEGAFRDGVVSEAEARIIKDRIVLLDKEKLDLDAQYNTVYANISTSTQKTNLLNAKNSFNSSHTALIQAINSAIADWKVTTTETQNITSKTNTYNSSLAKLSEEIQKSIDFITIDKIGAITVGGENLFLHSNFEDFKYTTSQDAVYDYWSCSPTQKVVSSLTLMNYTWQSPQTTDNDFMRGKKVLRFSIDIQKANSTNMSDGGLNLKDSDVLLKPNTEYTLSFYLQKSLHCLKFIAIIFGKTSSGSYENIKMINDTGDTKKFIKYSLTFNTGNRSSFHTVFYNYINTQSTTETSSIYLYNIQLEEGNKGTAWKTPGENIIQTLSAIKVEQDAVEQRVNKFQTDLNATDSKASTALSNTTSLRTDLNGLTGRVGTTETKVTSIEKKELNDFSKTGNFARWSNNSSAAVTIKTDTEVGYYADITTNTNVTLSSDHIEVNSNSSFKLSVKFKAPSATTTGSYYLGIAAYNKDKTQISVTVKRKNNSVVSTNSAYIMERQKGSQVATWTYIEGYIYGADITLSSATPIPLGNADCCIGIPKETRYIVVRMLNFRQSPTYGDGKTGSVFYAQPKLFEIDGISSNFESRIKDTELKITDDAIKTTVGKWHYSKSETDSKFKTNAAFSIWEQNYDKFTFSIKSGARNELLNAKFMNNSDNLKHWTIHTYNISGITSPKVQRVNNTQWAYPDRYVGTVEITAAGIMTAGELAVSQGVELLVGKKYTINFFAAGHRVNECYVTVRGTEGNQSALNIKEKFTPKTGGDNKDNWSYYKHTFTCRNVNTKIEFGINSSTAGQENPFLWIVKPMLVLGELDIPFNDNEKEMTQGITTISQDGVTVSMADGDGQQGYTNVNHEGISTHNSSGERTAWFGQGNTSQIKDLTVTGTIYNSTLLKWNRDRPRDFYIGPTATGDGTGRNSSNRSNSLNYTLNWIWNTYGCYSWKSDMNFYIAAGTYRENYYIGGWIGSGQIRLLFHKDAKVYGSHRIEENTMFVVIRGRQTDLGVVRNEGAMFEYASGSDVDAVFYIRASDVWVTDCRMRRSGWSGSGGTFTGYARSAFYTDNNSHLFLHNNDIVGYYHMIRAESGSRTTFVNNRGHCQILSYNSYGAYATGQHIIPICVRIQDSQNGSYYQNIGTGTETNSLFEPKGSTPPPVTPTWVWMENSFDCTNLYSEAVGSGSSSRSGEMGQARWNASNFRGTCSIPGSLSSWCSGGRNFTVWITMTRTSSGGYYGEGKCYPGFLETNGSTRWQCSTSFAHGATKTFTVTNSNIASAITSGSMGTLTMWVNGAGTQSPLYGFFNKVLIKVKCEKQV